MNDDESDSVQADEEPLAGSRVRPGVGVGNVDTQRRGRLAAQGKRYLILDPGVVSGVRLAWWNQTAGRSGSNQLGQQKNGIARA
jgi:hypothetical protein